MKEAIGRGEERSHSALVWNTEQHIYRHNEITRSNLVRGNLWLIGGMQRLAFKKMAVHLQEPTDRVVQVGIRMGRQHSVLLLDTGDKRIDDMGRHVSLPWEERVV